MKKLIENFPDQLREAVDIANNAKLSPKENIQNIIITGLGGSGIGGTIVSELVSDTCSVPVLINKDYFLPHFVNHNSLVIISSYSGNTEETLEAMQQALTKKAQIVCITSGGKVEDIAKQHNLDVIKIPGGNPPRSCIGYSLVQLIKVFVFYGFAPATLIDDIKNSTSLIVKENITINTEAKKIAQTLLNKIPVIYSLGSCEGVSVRFRQQINENSKMLCWHHVFPEMNHNELVGWTSRNENIAVVTFRTSFDYKRTQKRYEVCKPVFEKYSASVTDIVAKGNSKAEQFIYLINIGDWISLHLAELKGIDPVEVNIIDHLKKELSKF
ncbi:MAG TPA: bifunctional phosphoglucose/phosphomannose isomerase [Bacteroidia bacterium]|jgi:glucose/mannose-6-phosphate isomerase|nr:bifunctional phosphoglucose/phosphomannose isomerase [Bacteroidia bacterium]